jgi:hypothetical protein
MELRIDVTRLTARQDIETFGIAGRYALFLFFSSLTFILPPLLPFHALARLDLLPCLPLY